MTSHSVTLSEEEERRLLERAKQLNVPADEYLAAVVKDALAGDAEDFRRVAEKVLNKNRELYKRLS